MNTSSIDLACKRCGGIGFLAQFSYYYGGICFACEGSGVKGNKKYSDAEFKKLASDKTFINQRRKMNKKPLDYYKDVNGSKLGLKTKQSNGKFICYLVGIKHKDGSIEEYRAKDIDEARKIYKDLIDKAKNN